MRSELSGATRLLPLGGDASRGRSRACGWHIGFWLLMTLNCSLQLAAADCVLAPSGLVSWWAGDGNAADIAFTNNGALQGGATASAVGRVGAAFGFDGTNAFVQVPDSPSLRPTNLTIECWVRFTSLNSAGSGGSPAGDQYIVFRQNSRSSDFEGFDLSKTRVGGSNVFRFAVASASGQVVEIRSATLVSTGAWYHVAAARGSNFVQLYVDGALERQTNVSFPQDYGSHPLYFGSSGQSYWDRKFKGTLDEVSLYNRALGSNEIAAIYAAGGAGKCKAPNITLQPQDQTVAVGSNATFSVAATGFGTLSYQWRFNDGAIPGATSANLTLATVQPSAAGSYSVVVTNALGAVTSSNAVLTVLPACAPTPAGLVAWWPGEGDALDQAGGNHGVLMNGAGFDAGIVGQALRFNGSSNSYVEVADSPRLRFTNALTIECWVKRLNTSEVHNLLEKGGDWTGGQTDYEIGLNDTYYGGSHFGFAFAGGWRGCAVTPDTNWHHYAAVVVSGQVDPVLYIDGVPQTVTYRGGPATMTLTASTRPLHLGAQLDPQTGWYYYSSTLIDELSFFSRALSAAEIQAIYNAGSSGKCPLPPTVLDQPTNQAVAAGGIITFSLRVGGTPPLAYQWFFDGGAITGATSGSLTISNAQPRDAGSYFVVIANSSGSATSAVAVAQVGLAPSIVQAPASYTNVIGYAAQFAAAATGTLPLGFQWLFNDAPLADDARRSGSTSTNLTILNLTNSDAGSYAVLVTNLFGSVTSAAAVLTVAVPPIVTNPPVSQAASLGATATFRGDATALPPPMYRWQKDGADLLDGGNISGAATATLSIGGAQPGDEGTYQLTATNAFGGTISTGATLTVVPVVAWGSNGVPALPPASSNAVQIAGGFWHNLALRADGRVVAWGGNSMGQSTVPDSATNVIALAAGYEHSLALRMDGTMVGWGRPPLGTPPPEATNLVAIAAGEFLSLALREDGTVFAWALNDTYIGSTNVPAAASNVVAIAAGGFWCLALRADGTVVPWGDYRTGCLNVPSGLSNVVAIAAGDQIGLARRSESSAVGWGDGFQEPPSGPDGLSNVIAMAAGNLHTLLLYPDGTVYAWGDDFNGQCDVPPYATNIVAISAGYRGSMALIRDSRTQLAPSVWLRPGDRFVGIGRPAVLRSRAGGSLPLNFQWLRNGQPLIGETNAWLALLNPQMSEIGDYQIVVSNPCGTATSEVSSVSVLLPPTAAVAPTNASWIAGGSGSLVSVPTGTPPFQYQWYRGTTKLADDARLSGTTNSTLTVSSVLTSDAGTYTIVVTDPAGSTASATSTVSIIVPPSITAQPRGWSVPVGMPVQLSATASGTAPLSYQWRLNGTSVPGATSNALSFAALTAADFGNYQLVVTNLGGAATSAVARLTRGPVAIWGYYSQAAYVPIWPAPGLSNVIAVAGGIYYSLALRGDGTVYAWGVNSVTNVPAGLSGIVGIAAGLNHALAIRSNGTVVAWGSNSSGQTNVPANLNNAVAVTAGISHSAALRADGTVVVWGGSSRTGEPNIPPGLIKVAAIDANGYQTLALRENGTVVGWGGASSATPVPPYLHGVAGISAASALGSLNLALLTNGTLAAWNGYGPATNVPAGLTNLVAVEAIYTSSDQGIGLSPGVSLVLRSNGTVVAWGSSIGGITNVPPGLSNGVALASGPTHALALVNDGPPLIVRPPVGGTFCLGADLALKAKVIGSAPLSFQWFKDGNPLDGATNDTLVLPAAQSTDAGSYQLVASNALGVAQSLPVPVTIVDRPPGFLSQPAAGLAFLGSPWSLGASVIGSGPMQLTWSRDLTNIATGTDELRFPSGLPEHTGLYYLVASNHFGKVNSDPTQIIFSRVASWGFGPNPTNAPFDHAGTLGVASGYFHALAIQPDRTVRGWGTASYGDTTAPPGLSNVIAVAAGSYFSLALKNDGTVAAWGLGSSGQTNVPASLTNAIAISAGGSHTLALRADGTVTAWGTSTGGVTNVPAGLSNVVAIAGGNAHSMALKNDGSVVLWGAYGKPPAYTNVVAVSAGYNQCLVLQADGTVLNWSTTGATIPQPINLTNVVAISAGGGNQGYLHSVALRADGTLVAWGNNYYGQMMIPPDLLSATAISAGGGSTLAYLNDRSPAFTVQPWSRVMPSGTNVTLRALTVGRPPMRYQWYCYGQPVPGATNNTLTFTNTQPAQSGAYQLAAQNDLGAVTSAVATLTVTVPPVRLAPVGLAANGFRFSFISLPAVLYIVEFKDTLAAATWTELERRFGVGGLEMVTDPSAVGAARYYRVRALYAPPPRVASMSWNGSAVSFSFATVPGAVYVIQYKERLQDTAWLELSRQTGTSAPILVSDPNPAAPSRFYRVQVE